MNAMLSRKPTWKVEFGLFNSWPLRVVGPFALSAIGWQMATSSPYIMSKVRMAVASNPLIMASDVGSNLTVVHISDERQTGIITHSFLRKTVCFKANFLISPGNSLLSTDVLLSPKMCDSGGVSELEPAFRRVDFFQWKRRDETLRNMTETTTAIDNRSENIETREIV